MPISLMNDFLLYYLFFIAFIVYFSFFVRLINYRDINDVIKINVRNSFNFFPSVIFLHGAESYIVNFVLMVTPF